MGWLCPSSVHLSVCQVETNSCPDHICYPIGGILTFYTNLHNPRLSWPWTNVTGCHDLDPMAQCNGQSQTAPIDLWFVEEVQYKQQVAAFNTVTELFRAPSRQGLDRAFFNCGFTAISNQACRAITQPMGRSTNPVILSGVVQNWLYFIKIILFNILSS